MVSPDVLEKLKEHTSGWEALSDEQKVESLIARLRILVAADGFSVAEVELALDLALNAMCVIRGRGIVTGELMAVDVGHSGKHREVA